MEHCVFLLTIFYLAYSIKQIPLKRIVHPLPKNLSLFTHPHVVPNPMCGHILICEILLNFLYKKGPRSIANSILMYEAEHTQKSQLSVGQ